MQDHAEGGVKQKKPFWAFSVSHANMQLTFSNE